MKSKFIIPLTLCCYLLIAALYITRLPPLEGPDEAGHLLYIHHLLEHGTLPPLLTAETLQQSTNPVERWNVQAHHPPLYYWLASLITSGSERGDIERYLQPNRITFEREADSNSNMWLHGYAGDTQRMIYGLRGLSAILGMGTLLFIWRTARLLSFDARDAYIALLIPLAVPAFFIMSASVSNDSLLVFLYTAGIYWLIRFYQAETVSTMHYLIPALLLPALALTKSSGLTFYPAAFSVILFKGWQRDDWRSAFKLIAITLFSTLLLAGWWYLQNFLLYGDPLAANITRQLWGRAQPLMLFSLPDELPRIWRTFWIVIGHFKNPLYLPGIYYLSVTIWSVIGLGGAAYATLQNSPQSRRIPLMTLWFICGIVLAFLLAGTITIDISYGRILFPALGAFALLTAFGWRHLFALNVLFLLPLILVSAAVPLYYLPQAYPALHSVDTLPDSAQRFDWQKEDFHIQAVDFPQNEIYPGDTLHIDLYFTGTLPPDTILWLAAVDSKHVQRLGYIEIYPSMSESTSISGLQRTRVFIPLENSMPISEPRLLFLHLNTVDLNQPEAENENRFLEAVGPMIIDPAYQALSLARLRG